MFVLFRFFRFLCSEGIAGQLIEFTQCFFCFGT